MARQFVLDAGVVQHQPRHDVGQCASLRGSGEPAHGAGVGEHVFDPRRWVIRVHGEEGRTRLRDRPDGQHGFDGPRHTQRDHRLGSDTALDQHAGQPVRTPVEVCVADVTSGEDQRRGLRIVRDRVGHQVRQRPRRDGRATRHRDEQGPLQGSEDVDVADPGAGVGGDLLEDAHESFREADRRVLVEEVRRVAETRGDACRVAVFVELLGQGPLQIEVGGIDLEVDVPDLQVRQFQRGAFDVLELEHHLEQRRVRRDPGRAQDLHHPFERDLRVREGTQIGFPDTTEELGEGVAAVDVGAQDEGVDEHADHVVEFTFTATGDRSPDGNVVRAAHACQHDRQRGMQRHEHRGGVFPRQPHDAGVNVRVDQELDVTAAK
ncbi:hypothetical protein MLGJGCBP_03000 [Rhodococcus sp. T7]|nr:hypothetical protein MLGJGCBP_03000 [Rhodococcus sp. T7]